MSFASTFPGFRLRLTRWGLVYLVACVILGMAAVNTGNNALMAVLGLALGSYVVSGAWSRQVLGNIRATIEFPSEIYAGRVAVVGVEIENTSRFLPAYGLVVRDSDGRAAIHEPLLVTMGRRRHSVELVFPDRGRHQLGAWRLDVLLPLGFFLKSKELIFDREVLVYPRLLPTYSASVRRGGGRRSPDALESRGREGEVTQLRDFREGDELRSLHWKQTARQQRLVVVERQRTAEKPVFFVIDPRLENPSDPRQRDRFEHLVSEVATGVVLRLREGVPVGVVIGSLVVPPVRSVRQAPMLLRPLAEVMPRPPSDTAPAEVGAARTQFFSVSEARG
ncbi:MAG: DUF58 domain-containing protein [Acidobacteria bacterium]|nr:DUF58 domain-containing protein [Candidatus Sulfomarinibacter sp. MAG AM1]